MVGNLETLDKETLDRLKTVEELRTLQAPWYRKPGYLTLGIPVILVLGTSLADSWSGFKQSQSQIELLSAQKAWADLDVKKAKEALAGAQVALDELRRKKTIIDGQASSLVIERNKLADEKVALQTQLEKTKADIASATEEFKRLAELHDKQKKRAEQAFSTAKEADKARLLAEAQAAELAAENIRRITAAALARAKAAAEEREKRTAEAQRLAQAEQEKTRVEIERLNQEATKRTIDEEWEEIWKGIEKENSNQAPSLQKVPLFVQ